MFTYLFIRFPWESAFTGRDVTQPCCPLVANNEQHITADISYALRQHFAATHDFEWIKREGLQLATEIADFWQSRVVYNINTKRYDIPSK